MRSAFRRELLNAVFLTGGIFSAAMGIKGFLVSFVALGLHQMGAAFAARSTVGILGLAAVLAFVPFPDVTPDLVLTAVFGGFFLGAGIGLAIRGGAVLDGTEIAALLISRRGDLLRVGDIILGFNALLFVSAIALPRRRTGALFDSHVPRGGANADFVIHGIDEYTAVTIVSDHNGQIRQRIMHALGRGVTIYRGFGGMSGRERDILYCVITRLEIGKVKAIVREIDPEAFIVYHALAGAEGGVVKTRGFH